MSLVTLEPLETEFGSKTAVEQTENKRAPLTIRTIGEILDMTFDDRDLILANGYLALGERTAVCGMGGVGKSQTGNAVSFMLSRGPGFSWLGNTAARTAMAYSCKPKTRVADSNTILSRMLTAFTPDEQEAIKAGVFFHTLEADDDGFLMLDVENSERIVNAIAAVNADVVVYDPLRDFGSDDLNSDRYMTETLREISRITKRGNPKRIPLIIHHAGTGKVGHPKGNRL